MELELRARQFKVPTPDLREWCRRLAAAFVRWRHRWSAGVRAWTGEDAPAARRYTVRAALVLASLPLMGAGLVLHHLRVDRSDVPDIEPLVRFEPSTTGQVYDARGEVLLELAREYRWVVRYDEIPMVLRDAILAAEDGDFFEHSGVDYWVWPRVASHVLADSFAASRLASQREGRWRLVVRFPQGGSTITQQLVRNYFLTDFTKAEDSSVLLRPTFLARTMARVIGVPATNKVRRKLEEMRLSFWLEEEFRKRYHSKERAKQEILARYASFIYLGGGRYGFSAASEYYFSKPLDSYQPWDADKAAMLASIPKSPRDYAPSPANRERALRRRDMVLALMVKAGSLSPEMGAHCASIPLGTVKPTRARSEAPAVVAHALHELSGRDSSEFGLTQLSEGRIRIHTTVDNRVQEVVNDALEHGLQLYEQRHPRSRGLIQGSVVVLQNSDGRVLAEAGGRRRYRNQDARHTDFNRAVEALRQPGSALKPVMYLAAFARGANLNTEVWDAPVAVPMGAGRPLKWIGNYDGRFKGVIPMRLALAESRNCATMWVAERVGLPEFLSRARELGIHSPLRPYITSVLGASEVNLVELASVYRALASGIVAEPQIVERVTDTTGRRVLYTREPQVRPLLVPPGTLEAIQEALRGVVRLPSGTAHALDANAFPIPVMGKTGTTSDFRDALFVGSTYGPRGITVAVRLGFDDNRELGEKETGGRAALPIFREVMLRVYRDRLVGPLPQFPRDIEEGIDRYLHPPLPEETDVFEALATDGPLPGSLTVSHPVHAVTVAPAAATTSPTGLMRYPAVAPAAAPRLPVHAQVEAPPPVAQVGGPIPIVVVKTSHVEPAPAPSPMPQR